MHPYPRPDYGVLQRYLPDQTPIAVDLSDNRNLWGAHPAALSAVAEADTSVLSHYPQAYGEILGEAVASALEIDPALVTTGGGGSGILDATMRACAPTELRFLAPGWPAACALARMNGHECSPVPWAVGLDDPGALVGHGPALVFVPNPNNPTGRAVPDDWIREVQRLCEELGSILILDEAYGEYARPLGDRTPFQLALAGERTLCVKTMSKVYGLAGLRIGYGVASRELILEIDKARGPFTVSGTSARAGAAALGSRDPWLAQVVGETKENRGRVLECLRHRGYEPPESAANFVFVPMDPEAVLDAAGKLARFGVRTRPFTGGEEGGSGLRATVAPWEGMQRLLDGLDLVDNATL